MAAWLITQPGPFPGGRLGCDLAGSGAREHAATSSRSGQHASTMVQVWRAGWASLAIDAPSNELPGLGALKTDRKVFGSGLRG